QRAAEHGVVHVDRSDLLVLFVDDIKSHLFFLARGAPRPLAPPCGARRLALLGRSSTSFPSSAFPAAASARASWPRPAARRRCRRAVRGPRRAPPAGGSPRRC